MFQRDSAESLLNLANEAKAAGRAADAFIAEAEAARLSATSVNIDHAPKDPAIEDYLQQAGLVSPKHNSSRPLRILVISNIFPPQELGGYGRQMAEFSRELIRRGHSLRILTANAPELTVDEDPHIPSIENFVSRDLASSMNWGTLPPTAHEPAELVTRMKNNHLATISHINEFKPDVCLIGNMDSLGGAVLRAPVDAGIPSLHIAGMAKTGWHAINTPRSPTFRTAPCSQWLGESLSERGYCNGSYDVVFPGGLVENCHIHHEPSYDKLRIAYASLLTDTKGPQTLIAALASLHSEGINFSCELAGATPDKAFYEKLLNDINTAGMADKIRILGFCDSNGLRQLYARSNTFVFPSTDNEAFGKSSIEAMAAGLALVSTSTGGQAEIFEDLQTGIHFDRGNRDRLASALKYLIAHPDQWRRIACAGRKRAHELTTSKAIDALESSIERTLTPVDRLPTANATKLNNILADATELCRITNEHIRKNDLLQADESLKKIQPEGKQSFIYKLTSARLHALNNEFDDAFNQLLQAFLDDAGQTEPYIELAGLYQKVNRHDLALTYYIHALDVSPNDRESLTLAEASLRELGRNDDAEYFKSRLNAL